MFERFTRPAREAVIGARRHAVEQGETEIRPVHVLAGLLRTPPGRAGELLAGFGVPAEELATDLARMRRRGGVSDADTAALAELGIDVERIVENVERVHGENALAGESRRSRRSHVPFSGEASRLLERALREALDIGDRHIGDEHLLLALLAVPGAAADLLAKHRLDYVTVRTALARRQAG
jgi:ATP-dependent Clp protease ATP-binding subunit ClpA